MPTPTSWRGTTSASPARSRPTSGACTPRRSPAATTRRRPAPTATAHTTSARRRTPRPASTAGTCRPPAASATPRCGTPSRPASTGRRWRAGSRARPSAPTATASTRSSRPREPGSLVNPARVSSVTCGRCHGDERLVQKYNLPKDKVPAFEDSFHGLAGRAGSQSVANCASCHGVHNILPSSDPRSTVHPANLAKTCGACHPGRRRALRDRAGPRHERDAQRARGGALRARRLPDADPGDARLHAAAQRPRLPAQAPARTGRARLGRHAAAHEPPLPDRPRAGGAELPGAGADGLRAQVPRGVLGGAAARLRGCLAAARLRPPRRGARAVRRLRVPRPAPAARAARPAGAAAHAAEPAGRARRGRFLPLGARAPRRAARRRRRQLRREDGVLGVLLGHRW